MLELVRQALDRARAALAREFLGAQREFLDGLRVERLEKSILRLRALVPPGSPELLRRATERLRERLGSELGTEIEIRVFVVRPAPPSSGEFLVDEGNRTAWLLLESLMERRAPDLNPVYIYGPAGVGKTYLLQRFLRSSSQGVAVWNGVDFYATIARLVRGSGLLEWRRKVMASRIFVMDEAHRLAGKHRAQRELGTIMDELRARAVQMVFLGRHHPRRIRQLGAGLMSRMLSGFTVQMGPPLPETRRKLLATLGVTEADHPELVRAVLVGRVSYGEIVRRAESVREAGAAATPDHDEVVRGLIERVARRFGLPPDALVTGETCRRVSVPRQVAVFIARQAGISGAEMARRFGWSSPSTASYAIRRVTTRMSSDRDFRRTVESCI